jgi:hypothetical protein
MPRHGGAKGGSASGTKQKGTRNRHRRGVGSYARRAKGRHAQHYDRPYLEGTYDKDAERYT